MHAVCSNSDKIIGKKTIKIAVRHTKRTIFLFNMHLLLQTCMYCVNSPFSHCRFNLHRNRRGYSPVKGTACLTDSAVWRENALLLSESPYRNNWYPKIRFFVRSAKREDGNSATGGKHSPTACQSKKRWASYAGSGGKRGAMSSGSLS